MPATMKTAVILMAVVSCAYAQSVAAPMAFRLPPGLFSTFVRPGILGGAGAINAGLGMGNNTVRFGTGMANTFGQGLIGAGASGATMGIGLGSQGLRFGTSMVGQLASVGQGIASMIPGMAPVAAMATGMITMGAEMAETGGQLVLDTAQSIVNASADMASTGLTMGTGMVMEGASSGIGMAQEGVNMGANITISIMEAGEEMMESGNNMLEQGIELLGDVVAQATTQMNAMGAEVQAGITSGISATADLSTNGIAASGSIAAR